MDIKLFAFWVIVGILADILIAAISNKKKIKVSLGKLRIHHSLYGLIFIIIGFFVYSEFFIGLGLGLVVSHTARLKKLVFVERLKRSK